MEFPTALLGVALGVVLMPQLAAARAGNDDERYSGMLDWGLRLVRAAGRAVRRRRCWCSPCRWSRRCSTTARSRTATCGQVALALAGYGAGLLGLVGDQGAGAGLLREPGHATPMRIAIAVLVVTQLLNVALVPCLQHAGLALSIGLGALVNAGWLLVGLLRSAAATSRSPGWGVFAAAGVRRHGAARASS